MEYTYTIGRRKTSVATLRLYKKSGENVINEKKIATIYVNKVDADSILLPFKIADLNADDFYFTSKIVGGGAMSQLGAVKHALSRAIAKLYPETKKQLKVAGLITRDPRMVERKKPGLRKARRAEQYSKR
jgi:small subunit ribosomal protein S9